MNTPETEKPLLEKVKRALDDSNDQIDYATQLALSRARASALAQPVSRWSSWRQPKWLWLGAAIPATLAVFFMLQFNVVKVAPQESHSLFEDVELLAEADDIDTLSDLELYEWMGEQDLGADS